MHGAHMIATHGFKNFHMSHVEIFNAGQPRLARYPIHWHHAGYVGEKGGYDDPSSADSLRIGYLMIYLLNLKYFHDFIFDIHNQSKYS